MTYRERTTKQKANGDYFTIEIYQADPSDCAGCPLKARCVSGRSGARTVRRQKHEELVAELRERMKQPEAKGNTASEDALSSGGSPISKRTVGSSGFQAKHPSEPMPR